MDRLAVALWLREDGDSGGLSARTVVLALMVILPSVCTVLVVFGGLRLKAILRRIPRISSRSDLEVLRSEHRLHSTLASLIKPLLGLGNILFLVDLLFLGGVLLDVLYSVLPSIASILISLPFRAVEQQANDLPCADEALRKEWVELRQE